MNDRHNQVPGENGHTRRNETEEWQADRQPVEELAAEFADRLRVGDRVSIEEYALKYPDLAAQIRELFPAITAIERLNGKRASDAALASGLSKNKQLGDYRIVGEIARGGMGVVYEAEQVTLGRRVAVKVLPQYALRSPRDVQRFQREAQTAANLHHTNIVPVFGVGEQDGTHYIVMQLIRGVGLDEVFDELRHAVAGQHTERKGLQTSRSGRVKRSAATILEGELQGDSTSVTSAVGQRETPTRLNHRRTQQDLPTTNPTPEQIRKSVGNEYYRNVARIGLQAAQALAYAHAHHTLHRDVKPGNLLLDDDGVVWIADFGIAKAFEDDEVTHSGDVVGTLGYMAPERFHGEATIQSDIYSLGLTLYELLSFKRAFTGSDRVTVMRQVAEEVLPPLRKRNQYVPRDMETIVLKAAARNPHDRYVSAENLAHDLECFLEDRPIRARRLNQVEVLTRWCRRNRAVASLAASVLLLLATVLGVTTVGYLHATAQHGRINEVSQLAVSALDEIYGQLAPAQMGGPSSSTSTDEDEERALLGNPQPPLSKDVALLLENLLKFYDDLSHKSSDTQWVAIKSVVANRKVGDIRRRLGESEKAQAAYEQAIQRIDKLDATTRKTPTIRLEYARTQNGRGIVLQELRSFGEVASAHRKAIEHLDATSTGPTEQFELARSYYLLHLAERGKKKSRDGNRRDSEGHLQRAVDILGQLRTSQPQVPEYRILLAHCFLAFDKGCNSDGSLSNYQTQAVAILEELHQAAPHVTDYQFELAEAYRAIEWRQCWRHRRKERPTEELNNSEQRLRRALEVSNNLEIRNPDIPQYYALKKSLHHILASVLERKNDLVEAEHQYEQAIENQRNVVLRSNDPEYQRVWLYHTQLNHAQVLCDLNETNQARERLEDVVHGFEELLELPAINDSGYFRRSVEKYLAQSYAAFARVLNQLDEHEQAEAILKKAEKCDS